MPRLFFYFLMWFVNKFFIIYTVLFSIFIYFSTLSFSFQTLFFTKISMFYVSLFKGCIRGTTSCRDYWRRAHRKWASTRVTNTSCPSGSASTYRKPPIGRPKHPDVISFVIDLRDGNMIKIVYFSYILKYQFCMVKICLLWFQ